MMRKSNKKNDIILRNILNIAKIKTKDKKSGGKTQTDQRDDARDKRTKDATDLKRWQLIESPWIFYFFFLFPSFNCVSNKCVNPVSAHSW